MCEFGKHHRFTRIEVYLTYNSNEYIRYASANEHMQNSQLSPGMLPCVWDHL